MNKKSALVLGLTCTIVVCLSAQFSAVSANYPTGGNIRVVEAQSESTPVTLGVTTDDNVNLRTGPGTEYKIIAQLQRGTQRQVAGEQAGWYRVETVSGSAGWISADFFQVLPPGSDPERGGAGAGAQPPGTVEATIIDDGVNLRSGRGTHFDSYGRFAADVQVAVLGHEQTEPAEPGSSTSWYNVRAPSGRVGWVSAEYAVLNEPAEHLLLETGAGVDAAGPDAASPNLDVARLAEQFEGAPYIWGGASLSGFDCSGFTMYIYRQFGVYLPRKASHQYSARYGQRIGPIGSLLPGDLVFFERTTSAPSVTHVGIYVGDGKLIGARSERLGVRYVSLYEPFWKSRYIGGLRPDR